HDLAGCGGDHAKGKAVALQPALQKIQQRRQAGLEAHATAGLDQMLAPYAAKVRVMTDEIGELPALLHEIAACQSLLFLLETAHAEQLAQHVPRVVEAQRLIKIRCQQEMLR